MFSNCFLWIVVSDEEVVNFIKTIFSIHCMLPVVSACVLLYIVPKCYDRVRAGDTISVAVDGGTAFIVAYLFAMITFNA